MLAKLLPTKIADNNWSGFFRSSNALFALVFDFLDKFFNFILLAAIIPVSDPEKNPLRINKNTRVENKINKEGSSCITSSTGMSSCNMLQGQHTLQQKDF